MQVKYDFNVIVCGNNTYIREKTGKATKLLPKPVVPKVDIVIPPVNEPLTPEGVMTQEDYTFTLGNGPDFDAFNTFDPFEMDFFQEL